MAALNVASHVAGVLHCNMRDTWIVVRKLSTDHFISYKLTATGLFKINESQALAGSPHGYLKFSPDGKKMAVFSVDTPAVVLYDFNNKTGEISNALVLSNNVLEGSVSGEFSPDGSKLYVAPFEASFVNLIQWDLTSGVDSLILNSRFLIPVSKSTGMQLAPNGKIYVANCLNSELSVINNPNKKGASCGYNVNGLLIAPAKTNFELPNFVSSYLLQTPKSAYNIHHSISCNQLKVGVDYQRCDNCAEKPLITWDFGDGATFSGKGLNTDTVTHNYDVAGTYTVTLMVDHDCYVDTLSRVISAACSNVHTQDSQEIKVYPSITNRFLHIAGLPLQGIIRLTDINGLTVYTGEGGAVEGGATTLDFKNLGKGLYILSIQTSNRIEYYRVVVN